MRTAFRADERAEEGSFCNCDRRNERVVPCATAAQHSRERDEREGRVESCELDQLHGWVGLRRRHRDTLPKCTLTRSTPSLHPNHAHGRNQSTKTERARQPKKTQPELPHSLSGSVVVSLMSELLNALDGRLGCLVALMPHLRVRISGSRV